MDLTQKGSKKSSFSLVPALVIFIAIGAFIIVMSLAF